jgi:hypothetical protein
MTSFWLWVCAGCAASAAVGFSFTRFAVASLPKFHAVDPGSIPVWGEMPEGIRSPEPAAAVVSVVRERPAAARRDPPGEPSAPVVSAAPRPHVTPRKTAVAKRRAAPTRMPAPTAPEPEAAKLALWARQIRAGERKMSIATDGCRVTWNRTCKHGHPTWLVRLGYLERPRPPYPRHTPR